MNEPILPDGFRFAGVHCGVRADPERPDLALIQSERPASAAGVFTRNRVVAAPVVLNRERLPRADARAVVTCAGNANACTGEQGMRDARRMAELTAERLGCEPEQVLVCSTGVIGRPLPMDRIERGIPDAAGRLGPTADDLEAATRAILTTDTRPKTSFRRLGSGAIAGFAKGAAMIGPNMATMLAYVCSDAAVRPEDLAEIARRAAEVTFNCVSVEGHTSTNDSLILLANGAGEALGGVELREFAEAVTSVCSDLAREIASDAEGANHLVVVEVEGCRDDHDARTIAKAVSDSALVKTAIYGNDPNWGRIVSAAGYAGVEFDESEVTLWLGDMALYRDGTPLPFDEETASNYLRQNREVHLRLRLQSGQGRCRFYTCDLTTEYVRLNADYTT